MSMILFCLYSSIKSVFLTKVILLNYKVKTAKKQSNDEFCMISSISVKGLVLILFAEMLSYGIRRKQYFSFLT